MQFFYEFNEPVLRQKKDVIKIEKEEQLQNLNCVLARTEYRSNINEYSNIKYQKPIYRNCRLYSIFNTQYRVWVFNFGLNLNTLRSVPKGKMSVQWELDAKPKKFYGVSLKILEGKASLIRTDVSSSWALTHNRW